jgi:hypothetical protein
MTTCVSAAATLTTNAATAGPARRRRPTRAADAPLGLECLSVLDPTMTKLWICSRLGFFGSIPVFGWGA